MSLRDSLRDFNRGLYDSGGKGPNCMEVIMDGETKMSWRDRARRDCRPDQRGDLMVADRIVWRALQRASYYRWCVGRRQTLPGGDPITGEPRKTLWGARGESRAAYIAMARYWLGVAMARFEGLKERDCSKITFRPLQMDKVTEDFVRQYQRDRDLLEKALQNSPAV